MNLAPGKFHLENARELALYARMAYDEPPDVWDKFYDTRILVRDGGAYLIVSFCGTRDLRNFITDAEAWRSPVACGEVHHGFWNVWLPVKYQLIQKVLAVLAGATKPIFVTGHSLGGALAMIGAKYLAARGFDVRGVYTFGCPRIGNAAFAKNYNSFFGTASTVCLRDRTFTVINDCDIVPRVPGYLIGYHRPGHDECVSDLSPDIWEDPSVLTRLGSDLYSIGRAWCAQRGWLALGQILDDHHIDRYIAALNAAQPQEAIAGSGLL